MEDVFRRSDQRGGAVEEEKRVDSVGVHKEEIPAKVIRFCPFYS